MHDIASLKEYNKRAAAPPSKIIPTQSGIAKHIFRNPPNIRVLPDPIDVDSVSPSGIISCIPDIIKPKMATQ